MVLSLKYPPPAGMDLIVDVYPVIAKMRCRGASRIFLFSIAPPWPKMFAILPLDILLEVDFMHFF